MNSRQQQQVRSNHVGQGDFFYINSDFLEEDIQTVIELNITNIGINERFGNYLIKDLTPLLKVKTQIKKLSIECHNVNLETLDQYANLDFLIIGESNYNAKLDTLINLKYLSIFGNKPVNGLDCLSKIEFLKIHKADDSILNKSLFKNYRSLKSLILSECKFQSIDFFIENLKLKSLHIFYVRSTIDFGKLLLLKSSLEELEFERCPSIINFDSVINFNNLRIIKVVDSITISSCKIFSGLSKLEKVVVLGKSYFIDGDLSPLYNLNQIKDSFYVGIDNKKHYNVKYEEFKHSVK